VVGRRCMRVGLGGSDDLGPDLRPTPPRNPTPCIRSERPSGCPQPRIRDKIVGVGDRVVVREQERLASTIACVRSPSNGRWTSGRWTSTCSCINSRTTDRLVVDRQDGRHRESTSLSALFGSEKPCDLFEICTLRRGSGERRELSIRIRRHEVDVHVANLPTDHSDTHAFTGQALADS